MKLKKDDDLRALTTLDPRTLHMISLSRTRTRVTLKNHCTLKCSSCRLAVEVGYLLCINLFTRHICNSACVLGSPPPPNVPMLKVSFTDYIQLDHTSADYIQELLNLAPPQYCPY